MEITQTPSPRTIDRAAWAVPDTTGGYIKIGLERRREAMQKIEDELLKLCRARPSLVEEVA
jgi:hypothetical protein